MFGFNKKKNKSNTVPSISTHEASYTGVSPEIEAVLGAQLVGNDKIGKVSLTTLLTGATRQGDSLTLDMNLPEDAEPERIQYELGQALRPYGIEEINMNIRLLASDTLSKSAPKSSEQLSKQDKKLTRTQLPKVNDAMQTQSQASSVSQPANQSVSQPANQSEHNSAEEAPITKPAPQQSSLKPHPRIKHIIVVASGKGGVGKSTTTVNIALALQKLGNKVGVLDADIYGPSLPAMLGVSEVRPDVENEQFIPIDAYGLAMLSIGSLLDSENTPVAWRGPKATGALMQLFNQTNWPTLDYLVIDMPPGTGDIQLTLAQRIPVTGAVIVTTPQHIALMDAQKGIEMFNKTAIPVLGVVENMALHTCSNCGHMDAIFGSGGGETIAEKYYVPLLGQLPLAGAIRAQVDKGEPSVIANNGAGDDYAEFYITIAKNIEANIAKFAKQRDDKRIF